MGLTTLVCRVLTHLRVCLPWSWLGRRCVCRYGAARERVTGVDRSHQGASRTRTLNQGASPDTHSHSPGSVRRRAAAYNVTCIAMIDLRAMKVLIKRWDAQWKPGGALYVKESRTVSTQMNQRVTGVEWLRYSDRQIRPAFQPLVHTRSRLPVKPNGNKCNGGKTVLCTSSKLVMLLRRNI
jgi:hypothetical protein